MAKPVRSIAMFALLALLLGTSLATAQDGRCSHGPNEPRDVVTATERFLRDLDRSGYADYTLRAVATRFYEEARVGTATASAAYAELRRALHARDLPDDVLDSWDGVVAAWRSGRRPPVNPPYDGAYDPRGRSGVYFQGSFEMTPVSLYADDAEALRRECLAYVERVRPNYVDDVEVFGTRYRNGPSYWNREELCSLAAANARALAPSRGSIVVDGAVEDMPFHFEGSPMEVLHAIRALVPLLVGRGEVDDVTVNGRRHHNGPATWRPEEVAALVEQGIGLIRY